MSFYMRWLRNYPIMTKSITAGILMQTGDGIAQLIEYRDDKKINKIFHYDMMRGLRMGVFGTILVGPLFHGWFHVLDRLVTSNTIGGTLVKVGIDQAIMAPSFLTVFYFYMGYMDKGYNSVHEIWENMFVPHFLPSLKTNYQLWPLAQFINIYLIPMQFRVLWLNMIGLLFNIYLSYRAHMNDVDDETNVELEVINKKT